MFPAEGTGIQSSEGGHRLAKLGQGSQSEEESDLSSLERGNAQLALRLLSVLNVGILGLL